MDGNKSWSSGFEFVDIEIIDHSKQTEATLEKWNCDQCSLFFLSKQKLNEHKKKHGATEEIVKCQYCNKTLSDTEESKECYSNKKCETCEYRCSKCPQRFLRHSSLINHENNHVLLKKRKSVLTRPIKKDINGVEPTNGLNTKATKKKLVAKKKETAKQINKKYVSLRKKQKVQSEETPSEESDDGDSDEYFVSPTKKPKQALKRNKTEESPVTVKNTTTTIMSSKPPVPSTSTPVSSNTVNYKPFSCHVCGDTFASDNTLLEHIKSHGENAGNGFKCKHCGDEFDDIYKMQYHLAICPLAEDEMETSLLQSIPAKFQKKPTPVSDGTVRKRGRRKKVHDTKAEETSEIVDNADDLTPSLGTRGSRRKRKMEEEAEAVNNTPKVTSSSLPKRATKLRSFAANDVPAFNESADNGMDYADDGFKEDCQSEDPFETSLVNESYENEEDDRKKVHACPFPRCSIKFTREKALLCHMRNHNDDFDDALKCHKCDIPFDDLQSLRTHIDICKGIKEEKDDDFEQPSYVDAYDSGDKPFNTFQRSRGQFLCKICGRAYITQEKLDRCDHENVPEPDSTTCRLCEMTMKNDQHLKAHFKSLHANHLPYLCSTCDTEFDSKIAIANHRLTHKDVGRDFMCVVCTMKLPTYKDLYFHYSKDHVKTYQSICMICNIYFPDEDALREHNLTHTEDKFRCIFCPKAFSSGMYLSIHMKRHTNKKIYKCKICYRPFLDIGALLKHMLFHASTPPEEVYKCGICFSTVTQRAYLKHHISVHVKKCEFVECPICGETQQGNDKLTTHLYEHSVRISKNKMLKVESEWYKRSGGKTGYKMRKRRTRKVIQPNFDSSEINYSVPALETKNEKTDEQDVLEIKEEKKELKTGKISPPLTRRKRPCKLIQSNSEPTPNNVLNGVSKTTKDAACEQNVLEMIDKKQHPEESEAPDIVANVKNSSYSTENKRRKSKSVSISENDVRELTNLKMKKENSSEKELSITKEQSLSLQKTPSRNKTPSTTINGSPEEGNLSSKERPMSFICFPSLSNNKVQTTSQSKSLTSPDLIKEQDESSDSNFSLRISEQAEESESDDDLETSLQSIIKTLEMENDYSDRMISDNHVKTTAPNLKKSVKTVIKKSDEKERELSNSFIKEAKYFEPVRGLPKYSCTTCFQSLTSQEELLFHVAQHIF